MSVRINVGCGHVYLDGWINIDINPQTGCDIAAAVPPLPLRDGSVHRILASHFIEHVPTEQKMPLFNEFHRVLIPGGILEIYVPYALHSAAHQDPTHVSYWVPESGMYYTEEMAYLKYGIKVWSQSNWKLQANGWVVEAIMIK